MVFYGLNNLTYPTLTSSSSLLSLTNQNTAPPVRTSSLLGAAQSQSVSGLSSALPAPPNGARFAYALGTGVASHPASHAPAAANHLLASSAGAALLRKLMTSPLLVSSSDVTECFDAPFHSVQSVYCLGFIFGKNLSEFLAKRLISR